MTPLRPHIAALTRYSPGAHTLASGEPPIILSSNENPHGASPLVQSALTPPLDLHRYSQEQDLLDLKLALANDCQREENVNPQTNRILIGNGSDELIALLIQAFVAPGDNAIVCQHSFPLYALALKSADAEVRIAARPPPFRLDPQSLRELSDERTRLMFLANPDNPSGRTEPHTFLRALRSALPSQVLLVIDSAYAEYACDEDYDSGLSLACQEESVVMLRTFSKIHGLAALRLGWGVASERIANALENLRMPFSVNALALKAGLVALQDREHREFSRRENIVGLKRLFEYFQHTESTPLPSSANFLLLQCLDEKKALSLAQSLAQKNILVRSCHNNELPHCLRITIGTRQEVSALLEALNSLPKSP